MMPPALMYRPGWPRLVAKWGGLAACTAIALTLGVGARWWVTWTTPGARLSVAAAHGAVVLANIDPAECFPSVPPGWSVSKAEPMGIAFFPVLVDDDGFFAVGLPLWMPLALFVRTTSAAWLAERRERRWSAKGKCHCCRYDLTGNTTGVCPECGGTT